jgi:hypothetical protein
MTSVSMACVMFHMTLFAFLYENFCVIVIVDIKEETVPDGVAALDTIFSQ